MEIEKSKCEPGGGNGRSNGMEGGVTRGLMGEEPERYGRAQITGPQSLAGDSEPCKLLGVRNDMKVHLYKISSRKLEIPREHFMQRWAQ